MIHHDRPVRFEDIDAAGIVFFARFFNYCHDAMERLFDGIPGGYVELINRRKIGFPTVHSTADFRAPLRYGDVARIAVSVARVGHTSCAFRFAIQRANDGADIASVEQVHVAADLATTTKVPLPDDVRALLERHREVGST